MEDCSLPNNEIESYASIVGDSFDIINETDYEYEITMEDDQLTIGLL